MTRRLRASPLTLLFFRIGIGWLVVPILAFTLYGQAFYGSVARATTNKSAAALSGITVTLTNVQAHSSAVTHATDPEVTSDIPTLTQNSLFYAMLHHGVQPRSETSTSTLGDL
jgi:hypothetical protein